MVQNCLKLVHGFTRGLRDSKGITWIALPHFVPILVSGSSFLFVDADPLQLLPLGDPFLSRFSPADFVRPST